jgi:hypothetical protein
MERDRTQRKVVGVYDRPAGADRRRSPLIWIVAALIAIAWIAYFFLGRG